MIAFFFKVSEIKRTEKAVLFVYEEGGGQA